MSEVNILKAVTFENVSKTYNVGDSEVTALDHVSFSIEDESVTVILGPSGSGKSTMLNLIGGMDRASSGCIRVSDTDISKLNEFELTEYRRKKIGFVFQSFNLISFKNALENVALPLYYRGIPYGKRMALAHEYLDRVGLADRWHHLPNELSGGQKQRVAIARALITEPDIILADEPTGALDSQTTDEVMQLLHDVNIEGRTMIIVTHEQAVADSCSRIVHMKDGLIM